MSENYGYWADDIRNRYRGLNLSGFTFWEKFKGSVQKYSAALNEGCNPPALIFSEKSANEITLSAIMLELRVLLDPISHILFYSLTSQKLCDLRRSSQIPSEYGLVVVDVNSYHPTLHCHPKLTLRDHPEMADLDLIESKWKQQWPVSDILARCLVERVLDIESFKGTTN